MSTGFLLGKFMPPHAGHLFLCEVASARVDRLSVLLCSHDAEPIPGHLRAQWMAQCLRGTGIRLIHMHRDIPQEPADHPDFWAIWKSAITEHHPEPIDWVFGSEAYVLPLARTLAARPFVVDPARRAVPVSASAIRSDPARHWAHVPPPVRGYFQTRITLIGPESAGKTVMAEKLAARFGAGLIPEYGRAYDALFRAGKGWQPQDFAAIIDGHLALAGPLARASGPLVIEDTDPIQTLVWAEYLLGNIPPALLERIVSCPLPDLYLRLGAQTEWHDDGTRYSGDQARRDWFANRLDIWLDRLGATRVDIDTPGWDARQTEAETAVTAFLAARAAAPRASG
ncbi:MAG: AAA family ATPase [Paracoccus sp. (in: a-proteobacteria)]|nr:AAA family ATPase [Paracoccus sp. (in: a-proteobacteria)]